MPRVRTVLLKGLDSRGFVFFTNLESRKARQIAENSNVSLLFPWLAMERQVIVMGQADKLSVAESFKYFVTRPRGSQLAAWVSQQSSAISSRKMLEMAWEGMKEKFGDGKVPLPPSGAVTASCLKQLNSGKGGGIVCTTVLNTVVQAIRGILKG